MEINYANDCPPKLPSRWHHSGLYHRVARRWNGCRFHRGTFEREKFDNANAVKDSKASEEKAVATLSIEQGHKAKLQGMLESQAVNTRRANAEIQNLRQQITTLSEEKTAAVSALKASKKAVEPQQAVKRTYLGELEKMKEYAKKLIEDEPAKTEKILPNLSQQSKEMLPIVNRLRNDESIIDNDAICNSLISAGFSHVFYAHAFHRSANDEEVNSMLFQLWDENTTANDMARTIERYNLYDIVTKQEVRLSIKNKKKPYQKKAFDAVKMIAGDRYFSQMK